MSRRLTPYVFAGLLGAVFTELNLFCKLTVGPSPSQVLSQASTFSNQFLRRPLLHKKSEAQRGQTDRNPTPLLSKAVRHVALKEGVKMHYPRGSLHHNSIQMECFGYEFTLDPNKRGKIPLSP
ncbi:hypothetical protein J3R82DRAFT_373 [Butyriboletus roseoflavus]|nr:hypothetical protein J3R82DRAFT_373 [Butyriboletus roseoflavus]